MSVVNADGEEAALREIAEADAFFGKLTPPLLAAAGRLRWVQSPTASLEHYMFPALVDHPCHFTNMRGIYADVIADHVFGYILCFARNFPLYLRQQLRSHWEAAGGEAERSGFVLGPSRVSGMDRAPPASSGFDPGDRRSGQHRLRNRPARPGLRDACACRGPAATAGPGWGRGPVEAGPPAGPALHQRFRGGCSPAYTGNREAFPPAALSADEARGLLHQHRPWHDRGPGRPDRGAAGGRDRGGRNWTSSRPSPFPRTIRSGKWTT